MALATLLFDPSEVLDTPEAIAEYLSSAFESGDAAVINDAIGVVARAKGIGAVAANAGVSRTSLYKSLAPDRHPEFATVLKVLGVLGISLRPVVTPS